MWYRDWTPWTPGPDDAGQAEECSREQAVLKLFGNGWLSGEERCSRALRAMELERVATETRRAAAAIASDYSVRGAPLPSGVIRERVQDSRVAVTLAALNLMGIPTMLPGEGPYDLLDLLEASRIYLHDPTDEEKTWRLCDSLDALSGLIGDFRRSTIFINGLRIEPVVPTSGPLMLVAAHPAIMVAFGEFLAQKYVMEGWSFR